jgi:hypothetical protein
MRPLLLLVLALALASCGEDDVGVAGAPEDVAAGGGGAMASCIDGVQWNGTLYAGTMAEQPLPPAGEPLDGGTRPACNDTGGAAEAESPASLTAVEGLPPEVAIYDADRPELIYASNEHFLFLGVADSPAARGESCTVAGTVDAAMPLTVDGRSVTVAAGTRFSRFARSSLPYLAAGDRVKVSGKGCTRRELFAREIELRP